MGVGDGDMVQLEPADPEHQPPLEAAPQQERAAQSQTGQPSRAERLLVRPQAASKPIKDKYLCAHVYGRTNMLRN
jgi:hypothetical protein